jgi:hypothetical protein
MSTPAFFLAFSRDATLQHPQLESRQPQLP